MTSATLPIGGLAAAVAPGRLTLPLAGNESLLSKKPGDILVGTQGRGFMRVVESVSQQGNQIVVQGPDATLPQVIRQGELSGSIPLGASQSGVKPLTAGPTFGGVKFGIDDTTLLADSDVDVKLARAHLTLGGALDFDTKIGLDGVTYVKLGANVSANFDAAVDVKVHDQLALQQAIWKNKASALELGQSPDFCETIVVAFVPVVVCAYVEAKLTLTLKEQGTVETSASATANATLGGGVEYQNGSWKALNNSSLTLTTQGPTVSVSQAQVEFDVGISNELHVLFYGVAGPYFGGGPYAGDRLTFTNPPPALDYEGLLGWKFIAGGEVKLFGLTAALQFTLWDKQFPFGAGHLDLGGSGGGGPPGGGGGPPGGGGGSQGATCVNNPGTGNNCGDESVMSHGDANTLYHCSGPGPASVVAVCSSGCTHNPPGVDDACASGGSTGATCVNNPGTGNNCGDESVMSHGDANTLYHCSGAGPATIVRACPFGCVHEPPGVDDVCAASGCKNCR